MMDVNGRPTLLLGLSFANLDKLRAAPGDDHIRISGHELHIPFDIIITAGRTEADLAAMVAPGIGPETKVSISGRLKN
jgi:hypothetical protein